MTPGTSRAYARGARRGAAILAALGSFALGCSSILGIADGIGYLGGDGGLADGSTPADGPGSPDAPFDSGSVEASGPADAALDAGFDAAGCDANVATDTHNCGACGHDCLGAPCEQSQCQPVAIVTGQDNPLNVSVDAVNVYWTNNDGSGASSVLQCPKSGCTNTSSILSGANNAWGIVATDAGLYFTQDLAAPGGEVDSVPAGGTLEPLEAIDTPKWIAADTNDIYFTANGDTALYSCLIGASSCSAPAILTEATDTLEDVAALGGAAYVTFLSGAVESISANGGSAALIYQDSAGIFSIAVDANNVYYTNPQVGTVTQRCLAGGCSLVVLASAQARPWRIAVDAATVYWTDITAGKVLACPIGGSCGTSPAVIASVQTAPWGIAVDDTRVYWTTHAANGAVMSVVK